MHPAILRDRGHWTRTTLLSLLVETPGLSRSALARRLGITAQAVSVQVTQMEADGLLRDQRATPSGIERLADDATSLAAIAKTLGKPLQDMHVISAVAGFAIEAGTKVTLAMEGGDLVARPGNGASTGMAQNSAAGGDEVRVANAHGVVELEQGHVQLVRVPDAGSGGITAMKSMAPPAGLVAAVGTGATILARKHGRLDIPFAGAAGACNAAQRGLDVRLYVNEGQLADALHALQAVEVHIVDAA
jgi:predicted transcriptional regulator